MHAKIAKVDELTVRNAELEQLFDTQKKETAAKQEIITKMQNEQ
jgi:hypothetical protein